MPSNSRPVYSTDHGRLCPGCAQPLAACRCKSAAAMAARPAGDGIARVSREKQGRGGKTVTVLRGLPLDDGALALVGKQLRSACGSGGTVKDGVIEIQGDHRERVLAWLQQQGHKAKSAGG